MKTDILDQLTKETPRIFPLPDFLDPSIFFSDRMLAGTTFNELALQWAVFTDGLKRYSTMATQESTHASEEFLQEEAWVEAEEQEWMFSFIGLSRQFGFEPESLRRALLAWKYAHQSEAVCDEKERKPVRGLPQA